MRLHSRAHEPQLLSRSATTTKARAPRAHAPQQATAMRSPRAAMKEKACAQQLRPKAANK